ncbi:MAG: hypothetical protein JNM00_02485, partial [Flavobacteriales bacterium]|nr:hypothetical protein [Flavobacteriales bacterium]
VFLNDHIEISVHCSHIGTKSLTFEYLLEKVTSGQRVLCAKGKSVLVCYNHQTRSTMEVPEEWKNILK